MDLDQILSELKAQKGIEEPTFTVAPVSSDDLQKEQQKARDLTRIAAKDQRETARIENAVTAYNEAILKELQQQGAALADCPRRSGPLDPTAAALVVHLSDNHFNELVNK